MWKHFFLFLFILPLSTLNSQTQKESSIGLNALIFDRHSLEDGSTFNPFKDKLTGLSISYKRHLSDFAYLKVPLRFGTYEDVFDTNTDFNGGFAGVDIMPGIQYQFKNFPVIPYFNAGIGVSYHFDNQFGFDIPAAAGLDIQIANQWKVNIGATYRLGLQDLPNHLQYSIGFVYKISSKSSKPSINNSKDRDRDGVENDLDDCPDTPGLAKFRGCPDVDLDGIMDKLDDCPNISGLMAFNGCPDTDGDGIADPDDYCPTLRGNKKNNGCPGKDSDNDTVPDDIDRCPNEPGLARYQGCPDSDGDGIIDVVDNCPDKVGLPIFQGCPDTDGDGVADDADLCPVSKGPIENNGCPVLPEDLLEFFKVAGREISFETGSAILNTSSHLTLNKMARYFREYADFSIQITGHTDNIGNAETNKKLSAERAKACYEYLVAKLVPPQRMSYSGLGEENPIMSNTTAKGRQTNRRVEFDIILPK